MKDLLNVKSQKVGELLNVSISFKGIERDYTESYSKSTIEVAERINTCVDKFTEIKEVNELLEEIKPVLKKISNYINYHLDLDHEDVTFDIESLTDSLYQCEYELVKEYDLFDIIETIYDDLDSKDYVFEDGMEVVRFYER